MTLLLDDLMTPVADCLDRASLEALAQAKPSPEAAARMEQLAAKANEGRLSEAEAEEYGSGIEFANFLDLLMAKARKRLATQ